MSTQNQNPNIGFILEDVHFTKNNGLIIDLLFALHFKIGSNEWRAKRMVDTGTLSPMGNGSLVGYEQFKVVFKEGKKAIYQFRTLVEKKKIFITVDTYAYQRGKYQLTDHRNHNLNLNNQEALTLNDLYAISNFLDGVFVDFGGWSAKESYSSWIVIYKMLANIYPTINHLRFQIPNYESPKSCLLLNINKADGSNVALAFNTTLKGRLSVTNGDEKEEIVFPKGMNFLNITEEVKQNVRDVINRLIN